jgi:Flp pilus assembly protein TadG
MTRRSRSGMLRDIGGATALEFAMVAPVLIVLLIGVFNLGYALYCGAAVRHAVQQSSRALLFDPNITASAFKATVTSKLDGIPVANLTVAIGSESVTQTQQLKRITWTYDYMVCAPFMPSEELAMGSSLTVPLPPPI